METAKKKTNIIIVMPAYNAARTITKTLHDIPSGLADEIIVVDDASTDNTVTVAKRLGLTVIQHKKNRGYGGNQKTCYQEALRRKPDIVIMLHPDYQYDATLLYELIRPIQQNRFDFMFGSRIRTRQEALAGGMPLLKYLFNRLYTLFANPILGVNFSEHMSGLRAYNAKTLRIIPYLRFSNNFLFDQQFTVAAIAKGLRISEIPIPVRYYEESSSIQLWEGLKFYLGSLWILFLYVLHKSKIRYAGLPLG